MSDKTRSTALLVLIVILVALAIWTLIPASAAKANDLGYLSMCPFAPWSTLALLMAAAALFAVQQYFLTRAP
jgi:hypothetical protein